ncbi:group III truncated hemoglobin [Verrucomicrobiota bacterium sgz303538]
MHSHGGLNVHVPEKIAINPDGQTLYERLGMEGITRLVKWFYAKVRYEPLLEPVFNEHVHLWSEHIATITQFWVKMTGGPSTWSGGMGKHFMMHLGPEHFAIWLRVWDENCHELLPPREAAEMSGLAHRIGDDLQMMIQRASRARRNV